MTLYPAAICLFLLSFTARQVRGQEASSEEEILPEPEGHSKLPKYHSNRSYPIAVPDLEFYVKNDTGIELLKEQFHSVPQGPRKSWVVASSEANILKNRYKDLLAYDETRVVLIKLPDDNSSDYINANYIDGYNREKEYVATQGPLPNTVNDFWRMVWQLKACRIAMLANVIEHGELKVAKYWPDNNGTYGELVVKMLSEKSFRDHVVRTFSIRKVGDIRNRIVRQFHYIGWPDFGVPQDPLSVVALMQQVRKYRSNDTAPLIVHCSAGVGRTGTVILLDSSLERARNEGKTDFLQRLDIMREQRIDVVEKEGQYVFAHEAVNDVFNGNGTDAYFKEFDDWYQAEFGTSPETAEEPER